MTTIYNSEDIYLGNVKVTEELSQDLFEAPNLKVLLLDDENIMNIWKYGPTDFTSASSTVFTWQMLPLLTGFWIYLCLSQQNN